jgi:glycosyltransferase involved in cell wall biosynthesis
MGLRVAGGDVISITLVRHLSHAGHRVIVVTSAEGRRSFEDSGVETEFRVFGSYPTEPSSILGSAAQLVRKMVRAAAHTRSTWLSESVVVLPSSDMLNDVVAAALLRGAHVRRMALFHTVIPSPFRGYIGAFSQKRPRWGVDMRCALNWLQQQASIIIMRSRYHLVIPVSQYVRERLNRRLPSSMMANFNLAAGIDEEGVKRAAVTGKLYDACWVGRANPTKGIGDLLQAWELVRRQRPNARLAVVGDLGEDCVSLTNRLGLQQNVVFLGYRTGVEKFSILKQSRLFLFPSYWEGRPVAIAEAMACGLPVVAYDLPVYRRCYPDGMVTARVGDFKELAHCVLRVLKDEGLYSRLRDEAEKVVSVYNWETSVAQFLEAARAVARRKTASTQSECADEQDGLS